MLKKYFVISLTCSGGGIFRSYLEPPGALGSRWIEKRELYK